MLSAGERLLLTLAKLSIACLVTAAAALAIATGRSVVYLKVELL